MIPPAHRYQVLARRYRPQRFSDVVGQTAVLRTLKNAIQREVVAHAYLFSGPRGIGKTTLARLFAKALNCTCLTPDKEPCNECPSCLDISSAQSLDVIEIDGASHRGIDDIRQINETVGFAPSLGKYKIYILDEVHMLTKEAFNALLKTLEEPPEQAIFFFATTEAHKVLPTILSRCQRFDLGRLLPAQIIAKLQSIATDLSRPVEVEALHLIAVAADGSLRDAESLFDQILCFSNGAVTACDARSVLGLASNELFFSFDKAFAESNLSYAFEIIDHLYQAGKDLSHFLEQLIEHYRHIAICKTMSASALQMPEELSAKYTASASLYTQQHCFAALDILLKAEVGLSRSSSPRTTLELTLLQILRTKNKIPIEALVRRLSELEEALLEPILKEPKELPLGLGLPKPDCLSDPAQSIACNQPDSVISLLSTSPEPIEILPEPREELQIQETEEKEIPAPAPVFVSPHRPPEFKEVPFNPHRLAEELTGTPKIVSSFGNEAQTKSDSPGCFEIPPSEFVLQKSFKHQSHYDTLIRFAAVELEGTVKN